jgi:glycosyltransferase involved in cell wall biosynthesis
MRILMFSHGYPPTLSGVTLVVQKISRAMVQLGHDVTVVTASDRHLPYLSEDQGVRLLRIFGLPNPGWWEGPIPVMLPPAIRKLTEQFRPDVIHTHENVVLSNALILTHWKKRPAFISSCYSLPSYVIQYLHLGRLAALFERFVWKVAVGNLNHFEHVVFCTRTHQRDFLAHGLQPPTTVISNGVNIQRYCPDKTPGEDVGSRYQLPDAPLILSVGRLMKDKKLDILVRAMRLVCNQKPAHLLVVGRGSEHPHLKVLISQLELEQYIHLLGYVPEEDLPALYRACHMFAIPSLVEVQSLPALQAAVTGLPIVAANSAALPELVRHGENGLLVSPMTAENLGNAILTILNNPQQARQMGKVSLEIGRAHDEQLTFQAYNDFYCNLAGNHH